MSDTPRIMVVSDLTRPHGQELQRGVVRAVRSARGWPVDSCQPHADMVQSHIEQDIGCGLRGIVAHCTHDSLTATLVTATERGMPVINVSDAFEGAPFPQVLVDSPSLGRNIAGALQAHGFTTCAYVGDDRHRYSQKRIAGIEEVLGPGTVTVLRIPKSPWSLDAAWFRRQLQRHHQPGVPMAICLGGGETAFALYAAARSLGLLIPDDLAVYDLNNDPSYAESLQPTLSGQRYPHEELGRAAAHELLRLIDGGRPRSEPILVPPTAIDERQSSDTWAVEDPLLRESLVIIRDSQGLIDVPELARRVGTSRRPLEKRFRAEMGRSPHEHILIVRLDRARALLLGGHRSITDIALDCGFCSSAHFGSAFRKRFGITPSTMRNR